MEVHGPCKGEQKKERKKRKREEKLYKNIMYQSSDSAKEDERSPPYKFDVTQGFLQHEERGSERACVSRPPEQKQNLKKKKLTLLFPHETQDNSIISCHFAIEKTPLCLPRYLHVGMETTFLGL